MFYDLALIAVLVGAGYWGAFFAVTRPHGTPTFGLMLLGAALAAGLGLIGRHLAPDTAWLGVAGAIGLGAGTCLLVVGPRVRALARRMVASERLGLARRLLDIAELLAPGSGVDEEKAVLHAMTEIREGRIDQTVDALTAAKDRAPAAARVAIDERIAMLYIAAYRWRDAIAHAEAHLFGAPPPDERSRVAGGGDPDGVAGGAGVLPRGIDEDPASLRHALGMVPPVWVELLGAYGRVGDLEQAARMVARLEDACAGRSDGAVWIHRARLMFLALAGRIEAVRALVAPAQASHLSAAARTYWTAVAHEHHGDRAEAVAAYVRARGLSRGRARELVDAAIARLAEPAALAPTEPAELARDVIARLEAAPLPPQIRTARPARPRATWALLAALVATSLVIEHVVGGTADVGVLTRAGALVRGAVDAGEWWRLVSCQFVHVSGLHLLVNAAGLYFIGRLAEQLFGSVRTVALFAGAGIAGALASYLASPGGVSAGASGAVFGLLGAVFVEISWHRQRYRVAWKRGMWGGLAVAAVAQLAYDAANPMIDQWAHGGGLAAGALLGLALSPHARWSRAGAYLARAIALSFAGCAIAAAVLVVRTSLTDTLSAGPRAVRVVGEVRITVPAAWQVEKAQVFQPDGIVIVQLGHAALVDATGQPIAPRRQLDEAVALQQKSWKAELGELAPAPAPLVAVPPGWDGVELEAASDDAMGNRQRWRLIVCGRALGDSMVFISILVPEAVASAAPAFLAELIASTGPA